MKAGKTGSFARSAAVLVAMVVFVSLLIWAGVHNGRQRRLDAQTAARIRASQAALVPQGATNSAGEAEPAASKLQGKTAPAFTLVDLAGKKVSLSEFKGMPVLINFWATWCGPCKLEMPWFEEFHQKYAGKGLVILGVSADDAPKSVIAESVKKMGVTYPILLKDDAVTDNYGGVDYLPESFYVDRAGKVMLATAGLSSEEGGKDEIEANIRKLITSGGQ